MAGPAPVALSALEGLFQLFGEGPLQGAAVRRAAAGVSALPGCPPEAASFGSSDRATQFSVRKRERRVLMKITKTLEYLKMTSVTISINTRRRKTPRA